MISLSKYIANQKQTVCISHEQYAKWCEKLDYNL